MNNNSTSTNRDTSLIRHGVALVIAVGVIAASGFVFGSYSQRWGVPADTMSAVMRVEGLPLQIGAWQSVEELELGDTEREMLECAGYARRKYVNTETQQVVNVVVLVGPPGPIAVHTPEICYSSRAYDTKRPREELVIDSEKGRHTFWDLQFETRNALADSLQVCYGWSDGSEWVASKSPRFAFAAEPYLCKVQIAAPLPRQDNGELDTPCEDFLKAFVEVWDSRAKSTGSQETSDKTGARGSVERTMAIVARSLDSEEAGRHPGSKALVTVHGLF